MPALLRDDQAAFERLYQCWRPEVVSLCRRLLGRPDDAEDAAQETFLRAWMARDRYMPSMPFWPWLATIAQRLCVDQRRRTAPRLVGDAAFVAVETTPEQVVVASDELRSALEVIEGLRPTARRVLMLRELDGWSYRRIAAVEGVTVESVRGSLKRARASLRRL